MPLRPLLKILFFLFWITALVLNYDCENKLSDEMKSSNKTNNKRKASSYLKDSDEINKTIVDDDENVGSDEKGNDGDNIIIIYNKKLFHLN